MIRYTPIDLPREPYRPGRGATHPRRRAPGSHLPPLPVTTLTEANWTHTVRYLYAADLFNHGYWWEVHEVLEGLWLVLDRAAPAALFLQGLIQTSAAMLKHAAGESRAAATLHDKARGKLDLCPSFYLGLNREDYLDDLAAYLKCGGGERPGWTLEGVRIESS